MGKTLRWNRQGPSPREPWQPVVWLPSHTEIVMMWMKKWMSWGVALQSALLVSASNLDTEARISAELAPCNPFVICWFRRQLEVRWYFNLWRTSVIFGPLRSYHMKAPSPSISTTYVKVIQPLNACTSQKQYGWSWTSEDLLKIRKQIENQRFSRFWYFCTLCPLSVSEAGVDLLTRLTVIAYDSGYHMRLGVGNSDACEGHDSWTATNLHDSTSMS